MPKGGSDQNVEGCLLVIGRFQTEVKVLILPEQPLAVLAVEVCVDDPVLRHVPRVGQREVDDRLHGEEEECEEEQVELPCTAASQDEACLLAVAVDLVIESQAAYQVDKSQQLSNHALVDVSETVGKSLEVYDEPHEHQCEHED